MKLFKKLFNKKKNIRIILIHGFGMRTATEMEVLNDFLSKEGYDVRAPKLFDPYDENDNEWLIWVNKARSEFEEAQSDNKDIYVVGYSMGGAIATYLSTIFDVEKLVLLAPAFEYRTLTTAKTTAMDMLNTEKKGPSLPSSFYIPFMNLVDELGDNVNILKCPVLIIQGSDDQTIPQQVAKRAYKKIPGNRKRLIIIEEGTHRLMDDKLTEGIVHSTINNFFNDKL